MVVYPQKGKCKTIMNNVLWIVYKNGMVDVGSDATSLQYALLSLKIKKCCPCFACLKLHLKDGMKLFFS